jgi:hypothetical protein
MEVKKQKMSLKQKMKGQVSLGRLQTYVIAFVVIGVAGTVGLSILATLQSTMTVDEAVSGELDQPTAPLPANYTLDKSTESDYVEVQPGSVEVKYYDSSAGTNTTLTEDTDYVVYNEEGTVEVLNTSTTTDYDDTSDEYYTDYTAEMEDAEARSGAQKGIDGMNEILGFLPVIGLVVAAAVVIGLVGRFGSNGRRGRG